MPGHDIVVVGASAGGVEALTQLVAGLPEDLPAALFVVLHVPAHGTSVLPQILTRRGKLKAVHATDGEAIENGRIYVAPPDCHLLVKRGRVCLGRGPRENGHRPSVDPLFRSAAVAYGSRVVGVILSGVLDDGTAGMASVKRRGGATLVQDPEDALYAGMPTSAIENVGADEILSAAALAGAIVRLSREPAASELVAGPEDEELEIEAEVAEMNHDALQEPRPGVATGFSCPECNGVLWEVQEGELSRFRCRVGHAYSADTLLAEQSEELEHALWAAYNALRESATLSHRMAERARSRGHGTSASRFEEQALDTERRAALVRRALEHGQVIATAASGNGDRITNDPAALEGAAVVRP
jgi:two-component system, chemotaxis family, protein-glutamate methylesterase/glutaminase